MEDSTIFALSTPFATSPLAVIRVSGDNCYERIRSIIGNSYLEPRRATLCKLCDLNGQLIDEAMVIWFKSPKSFTGEDMVEFHVHGNPLIISNLCKVLREIGFQDAKPGEFTKRALINGKLDMIQAEALYHYITAQSDAALDLARKGYFGNLSDFFMNLRADVIELLAYLEAHIDFTDEDIGSLDSEYIIERISATKDNVLRALENYSLARTALTGIRVVIVGRPNVGKSSLLNLIAGEERAIVSDIPGTTRDFIEISTLIEGFCFRIYDIAGLRETKDPIELRGIDFARSKIAEADLLLIVHDCSEPSNCLDELLSLLPTNKPLWLVLNKIDLVGESFNISRPEFVKTLKICALDPKFRKSVLESLAEFVRKLQFEKVSSFVFNDRQHLLLSKFLDELNIFEESLTQSHQLDIICENLRKAIGSIDELIGKVYAENVLDSIFSRFCIGK
ncbi:MAG: tRNA uridine-5-carboxymethylaminomethyl(34) synthesis GTPase MnmE [Deltaproteobacteria bacterium]|nr:tRNA uridine-5-carboxymethylaminomethyl(34) synthesis GTPase MnmE [Deltaproteobacteria bacterium]